MKSGRLGMVVFVLGLPVAVWAVDSQVFYLGGQTNMDGHGYVRELPEALRGEVSGVPIFHGRPAPDLDPGGGIGVWSELKPGHGEGFSSDGRQAG